MTPPPAPPPLAPAVALANFAAVVAEVEPLAEAACLRYARADVDCDFAIKVDPDPDQPPNAYQTLDPSGRPLIVFNAALIAEAQNRDELAFVLGHEAGHHIAGHLAQTQRDAMTGAILGGVLASVVGADGATVETAAQLGATVGFLRFSKAHELEADRIGTIIAWRAGYDPVLGAAFFSRLPDPGNSFLSTHPANADRQAVVEGTVAQLESRGEG